MVERVTVAVDGGPASSAALRWVIERARSVSTALEITTVLGSRMEQPDAFEEVLYRAKETVKNELPDLPITTRLRWGAAHEQLIAQSRHADLLVIGTNKTSAVAGRVSGTLPLRVAGQALCTTIIVPVGWHPGAGAVVAGWAGDDTTDAALDFAAKEAARRGEVLTIVHTWNAAPAAAVETSGAAVATELATTNRQLLDGAADRLRLAHPRLRLAKEARVGSAAVAIVRAASHASLAVVGSRGRGAVAGFFLGSVSHDVLQNMPAPVAVVPRRRPIEVYPDVVDDDLL